MNIELEEVIRDLITKSPHMSLATVADGSPWVCEVHFSYDEKLNLYFVSKQSTRHCKEISQNSNVAGSIVKRHELSEKPSGIYFEGSAKKLDNPTAEQIALYCNQLQRDAEQVTDYLNTTERNMYKISVKNWAAFGDFNASGKLTKHELAWSVE